MNPDLVEKQGLSEFAEPENPRIAATRLSTRGELVLYRCKLESVGGDLRSLMAWPNERC